MARYGGGDGIYVFFLQVTKDKNIATANNIGKQIYHKTFYTSTLPEGGGLAGPDFKGIAAYVFRAIQ